MIHGMLFHINPMAKCLPASALAMVYVVSADRRMAFKRSSVQAFKRSSVQALPQSIPAHGSEGVNEKVNPKNA
jgi:hypothetical protein